MTKWQYRICPDCKAHLDPDERCDCRDEKKAALPLAREKPQTKTTIFSLPVQSRNVNGRGRGYG